MSSSDTDDAPDGGEDSPLFRRSGGPSSGSAVGDVPVSQSLIKAASNVCFSLFVLAVLVVTVVAVTYQPPDPWFQSSAAITTSLSRVLPNSTFLVPDDSLLPTGEDFNSSSAVPAPARDDDDAAAAAVVSAASAAAAGNRTCDPDAPLNCSDPRVLAAVKAFNARAFFRKSIVFLSYEAPVPGPKPGQCDVAWRFRNRREKSWRRYRDYRRFSLTSGDGCALDIVSVSKFRSGTNAVRRPYPNLFIWSFLCGLGEAKFLNRTFVMDLNICLSGAHTVDGKDVDGKDFRYHFDF